VSAKRRVAVIDDSAEFRELVDLVLREEGPYEVAQFDGTDTTVEDLRQVRPATVILDIRLDEGADRGWRLLEDLRSDPGFAAIPVIVCTADTATLRERETELKAMPGVFILGKPFGLEQLEHLVDCTTQAAAVHIA
jgi:CheY-like chemotaxis protein